MSKSALELFSTNNTILIIAVITMILEIRLALIGSKTAIYYAIFWGGCSPVHNNHEIVLLEKEETNK